MSSIWIRNNGQAGLRDRLRTAIKEAGLTQAEAARQALVGRSHLVGGLNGNNWLTVAAVEALAHVLEIPADELVGDSIFKHEVTRFPEFDHMPPEVAAHQAEWNEKQQKIREERVGDVDSPNRTRAICCQCGSLRMVSTRGLYSWEEGAGRSAPRFVRNFRCVECDDITRHALIRVDEGRNSAEEADHAPTLADEARKELRELIARLRGFNVRVESRRRKMVKKKPYPICYEYDDGNEQWVIFIDDNVPARVLVTSLNDVWVRIATDDHGVDWDAREGVLLTATDDNWSAMTDELVKDVQRFLTVEHRKAILHFEEAAVAADQEASAP